MTEKNPHHLKQNLSHLHLTLIRKHIQLQFINLLALSHIRTGVCHPFLKIGRCPDTRDTRAECTPVFQASEVQSNWSSRSVLSFQDFIFLRPLSHHETTISRILKSSKISDPKISHILNLVQTCFSAHLLSFLSQNMSHTFTAFDFQFFALVHQHLHTLDSFFSFFSFLSLLIFLFDRLD